MWTYSLIYDIFKDKILPPFIDIIILQKIQMSKISKIDFNSNIEINESSAESLILSLTENDLFVFSPTSLELIDNNIAIKAQRLDSTTVGIVKNDIESFIKNNKFKRVVSLGNGKKTDVAK
jgi:hypothetical protein